MTSPADELAAAAAKLRALATAASADKHDRPTAHWDVRYRPGVTPGAPEQRDQNCALIATDSPKEVRLLRGGGGGPRATEATIYPDHGRYAAAMDPTVGLALAELLDTAAEYVDETAAAHPTHLVRALAVARQILGSTDG